MNSENRMSLSATVSSHKGVGPLDPGVALELFWLDHENSPSIFEANFLNECFGYQTFDA